ncbi:hypothetical protein AGLY_001285 [Aphis glycines]|uniref:Uncharacterized protein n=1 Tax=Aphis glycines TaxID=307491 RepID=A0A6G0UBN3_APHGL|nr:hypothetical protein AGLY_001285 [Aphis glycines]
MPEHHLGLYLSILQLDVYKDYPKNIRSHTQKSIEIKKNHIENFSAIRSVFVYLEHISKVRTAHRQHNFMSFEQLSITRQCYVYQVFTRAKAVQLGDHVQRIVVPFQTEVIGSHCEPKSDTDDSCYNHQTLYGYSEVSRVTNEVKTCTSSLIISEMSEQPNKTLIKVSNNIQVDGIIPFDECSHNDSTFQRQSILFNNQ